MPRARALRLLGQGVRLALFALAGVAAARFFWDALASGGWTPRAFLGFLLVTGAVSLVWRGYLDLRKAYRRYRA
jgi:hypothetical protein